MTPTAWHHSGEYFAYRNHQVFFRSGGTGDQTLLLLHGFPTASWDWHKVWEGLCRHFRVFAPDFIGYGFSDKPRPYPYSILDQADLCETLLGFHGVTSAHILAHDYGNSVAQELMARHTEQTRSFQLQSVCVLNGGLFIEAQQPRLIQKLLLSPIGSLLNPFLTRAKLRSNFNAIFGPQTPPTEAEIDHFYSLIMYKDGKAIMHRLIRYLHERKTFRDRWVQAMQQTKPLRLISGPEDPVSGRNINVRYRELIPDPDIVELEGIGHYPQTEAPEEVLRHFLAFQGINR